MSVQSPSARLACALALALVVTSVGYRSSLVAARQTPPANTRDVIAKGEYLVKTSDCDGCHTPWKLGENGPEPDMTRRLSGHPANLTLTEPSGLKAPWVATANATLTAWTGPWGRSYTANLTPDPETGIGKWTEAQFIATIRNGRHLGDGRPLLPPMPWEPFRHFADEDLAAIFAYLKSLPAVQNKVPEPVPPSAALPAPPPPAPIATLKVAPSHADPVARGRYLVTAKGCRDCHTPMTLGPKGPAYDTTRELSGFDARGPVPAMPSLEGGTMAMALEQAFAGPWGISFSANLTPDPDTGLGRWTEQQFIDTLRNGRHQGRGRQLLPPMPWPSFGQMTDEDLKAMFAYLKTVPAIKNRVPEPGK